MSENIIFIWKLHLRLFIINHLSAFNLKYNNLLTWIRTEKSRHCNASLICHESTRIFAPNFWFTVKPWYSGRIQTKPCPDYQFIQITRGFSKIPIKDIFLPTTFIYFTWNYINNKYIVHNKLQKKKNLY